MELLMIFLSFSALGAVVADEESCAGRCDVGFQPMVKCQCDAVCAFYGSCCRDYHTVCVKTRGDVFAIPEEDVYDFDTHDSDFQTNGTYEEYPDMNPRLQPDVEQEPTHEPEPTYEQEPTQEWSPELVPIHEQEPTQEWSPVLVPIQEQEPTQEWSPVLVPIQEQEPTQEWSPVLVPIQEQEPTQEWSPVLVPIQEQEPTQEWSPELVPIHDLVHGNLCLTDKPFDAFTDLKNGSIFAFQGQYFYELDKKGVVAGYPKQILDVWGVQGPIDAAFTRINCVGLTYLFKGMMYWRFNDGIMEEGFPRPIKDGFPGIPTQLDAALAIPASGIHGKEQVYFFKGKHYWQYVFEYQPTQAECAAIPMSIPFQRYAYLMADNWDDFFSDLFGSISSDGTSGPFSISQHWRGIPCKVDSAMIGKLFMVRKREGRGRRRGRKHWRRQHKRWHRKHSSSEEDAFTLVPSQSVYFFVRDKYYRVDLDTKRVAFAWPRYPDPSTSTGSSVRTSERKPALDRTITGRDGLPAANPRSFVQEDHTTGHIE
ncbi:LOW QUALITY PROTEIN: vitronectin-like [Leucoraja erinacea]|uniref:LOW QUALITY PROTEIN: vitronectin-like n=1 Tax=Leucoraja erinaceus TaxID=7782 RepID=UPI00245383DD|nr:LOW QUALITY PROTEIN: vitronectin-like [Leucoraja erinacea]